MCELVTCERRCFEGRGRDGEIVKASIRFVQREDGLYVAPYDFPALYGVVIGAPMIAAVEHGGNVNADRFAITAVTLLQAAAHEQGFAEIDQWLDVEVLRMNMQGPLFRSEGGEHGEN